MVGWRILATAGVAVLAVSGCLGGAPKSADPDPAGVFTDVAPRAGLTHTTAQWLADQIARDPLLMSLAYQNGSRGMPPPGLGPGPGGPGIGGMGLQGIPLVGGPLGLASMTGGIAVGDVDGNGWLDLVFAEPAQDRLYLANGNGTFREASTWLGSSGRGNGTAALLWDYDNDGWPDLFLGAMPGPSRLLHNLGGIGFRDVSQESGMEFIAPVQGAAAADIDRDGLLDLLLGNYQNWWNGTGMSPYGERELLWHNDGGGHFSEQGLARGIDAHEPTLAVSFCDYDHDGWPDLFAANDFRAGGILWHNRNGTFERALGAGVVSERNGMGAVWEDLDGDGWEDLYVSNIYQRPFDNPDNLGSQLFRNRGDGTFEDISVPSGAFNGAWAWGAAALDIESDGDVDLYAPNGFPWPGHPVSTHGESANRTGPGDGPMQRLDEVPQRLFVNAGNGTFTDQAEAYGAAHRVDGRGAAALDFDRDGATDVVATAIGSHPLLLRNRVPQGHAIDLVLEGVQSNRDAIGTRVTARWDGHVAVRDRVSASGYLSQPSPILKVGLGPATAAQLEVVWPSGATQSFPHVAAGAYRLREGGPLGPGR